MVDNVSVIGDKTILAENADIVQSTQIGTTELVSNTDVLVIATTVVPNTIPYFDENKEYVAKELNDFGTVIIGTPAVSEKIDEAAQTAAEEAAAIAAPAAAAAATAKAEQYRNEAEVFASNAETIADANTYYKTVSDPDGTIAGLAGTPVNQSFRVMQGEGVSPAQIYYRNVAGVAVRVADVAGQSAVNDLTKLVESKEVFKPGRNLFNSADVTAGYYLFEGTGIPVANATYAYSAYIAVAGSSIHTCLSSARVITFYDANKNYLSDVSSILVFTTPAAARYIRVSVAIASLATFQITFGTGREIYRAFVNSTTKVNAGAPVSLIPGFGFVAGKNKFNPANVITGTHIASDGTILTDTDTSLSVSELIEVDPALEYFCDKQYRSLGFYNQYGVFISRALDTAYLSKAINPIVFPANTKYIRIEVPNTSVANCMVAKKQDNGLYESYKLVAPTAYNSVPLSYNPVTVALSLFGAGKNVFNSAEWGKGYINEYGTLVAGWPETGTQYIYSSYLKVVAAMVFTGNYVMRFVSFYDVNFMFLSTVANATTFTVPANAVYAVLSMNVLQKDLFILSEGTVAQTYEEYKHKMKEVLDDGKPVSIPGSLIDQSSLSLDFVQQKLFTPGKNKYNKDTTLSGFINESGVITANANFVYSDFIEVVPQDTYTALLGLRFVASYDKDKKFLRTVANTSSTLTSLVIDADTYYIRVTMLVARKDIQQIEHGNTATAYEDFHYVAMSAVGTVPIVYEASTPEDTETPEHYGLDRLCETHMRTTKKKLGIAEVIRIAFIGDSYTRLAERYSKKVANYMWNKYNGTAITSSVPPSGYGYRSFGFDPNGNNTDIVGSAITFSGFTCNYNTGNGPDISSVVSSTAGASITFSLDTTAGYTMKLFFEGGAGVISILHPNASSAVNMDLTTYAAGMNIVDITSPVNGTGNVVITVVSGSVMLYGVNIEKTDTSATVFHKLGGSGSHSRQWANANSARFIAAITALNPNLCTIMLGTNDQGANMSYAEFKSNIITMIDRIRTAKSTADILLICPAENNRPTGNAIPMSLYAQAMYDIAKDSRNVAFLNMQSSFGKTASEYAYGSSRPWMVADNIHPDPNTGGVAIAAAIIRALELVS